MTANNGGTDVGNYDVVLTLKDSTNYKWTDSETAAKTLIFQITKATAPAVTVPTPDAVTYDPEKTLANVTLSGGWAWTTPTTVPTVGNSGYAAMLAVDDANYDYSGVEGYNAKTHKVTRTVPLTVNKASVKPNVNITGWTYGEKAKTPSVNGNTGNGAVTYTYAAKGSTQFTATVPTAAGEYTVKADIAATDNYAAGTARVDFSIAKAAITPTVSITGWTYGEKAKKPTIIGNTGNGAVTYTYAAKGSSEYSTVVPFEAGTYTVKAVIAETANYLGGEATVEFTIKSNVIVWNLEVLKSINHRNGESFTYGGVTLVIQKGAASFVSSGAVLTGYNSKDDSFRFEADHSLVKIELVGKVHTLNWPGAEKTADGVKWTGNANAVSFGKHIDQITRIEFTLDYTATGTEEMPEADFVTPGMLRTIEEEAFEGIGAVHVRISDNVTSLGSRAFANCLNLQSIYIPESVTVIENDLLEGCGDVTVYGRSEIVRSFAETNGFAYAEVP